MDPSAGAKATRCGAIGYAELAVRDVVLDSSGWVDQLELRPAMEDYFGGKRRGYRFPHGLSIFSILAWRLLMLNLWSRHYLGPVARAA